MSFFDQISKSLSYHGKAFGFIIANKFAWTLFVPIVVFIVLLGFGIFAVGSYFADMLVDMAGELLEESPFLITIFSTFIIIVIRILLFIIFGLWGGYVVVVVMSPFLAYVSEKTETVLSGWEYKFDFPQFIHDIFRGIALAVRNSVSLFRLGIFLWIFVYRLHLGTSKTDGRAERNPHASEKGNGVRSRTYFCVDFVYPNCRSIYFCRICNYFYCCFDHGICR